MTADSWSTYGAHRIPLDSFLRESVKSAVSVVFAAAGLLRPEDLGRG